MAVCSTAQRGVPCCVLLGMNGWVDGWRSARDHQCGWACQQLPSPPTTGLTARLWCCRHLGRICGACGALSHTKSEAVYGPPGWLCVARPHRSRSESTAPSGATRVTPPASSDCTASGSRAFTFAAYSGLGQSVMRLRDLKGDHLPG